MLQLSMIPAIYVALVCKLLEQFIPVTYRNSSDETVVHKQVVAILPPYALKTCLVSPLQT